MIEIRVVVADGVECRVVVPGYGYVELVRVGTLKYYAAKSLNTNFLEEIISLHDWTNVRKGTAEEDSG